MYWELQLASRSFAAYGPGRFPLTAQSPQFVCPGTASFQAKRCPLNALKSVGGGKEHFVLNWRGETETHHFACHFGAFRLCPALDSPVGERRPGNCVAHWTWMPNFQCCLVTISTLLGVRN
jgi:hypothetical protein